VDRSYANKVGSIIGIFAGFWLFTNIYTLGYDSKPLFWSDLVSAVAVITLSSLTLKPRFEWLRWLCCVIGLWITFAPLAFWTKSAGAYSNDLLLGSLIILASSIRPRISVEHSESRPPGWSYNPSAFSQRVPILTLAFIGFLSARYLAAFQLGHIDSVWDPFFGDGTKTVLTSDVSRAFPISDAGLGAFSYLLDALSGIVGDRKRWKTMPWMVILFGLMIIPPGVTSIVLVILQPVQVGAWCTICLFTALVMLLMVPPAIDEVVATVQFLRRSRRSGKPFWKTFWNGDEETDVFGASVIEPKAKIPLKRLLPWNQVAVAIVGAFLLFIPSMFTLHPYAAVNLYFSGALIVTFAIIAIAEVARPARYINILLGLWLLISPWPLEGQVDLAKGITAIAGGIIIILSSFVGPKRHHYGHYDRWVSWRPLSNYMRRKHAS
jgi:hypothetical protein